MVSKLKTLITIPSLYSIKKGQVTRI